MASGMHRGPRVVVTPTAVLVAVVAGAAGRRQGWRHRALSLDGRGRDWAAPVVVNDVPAAAREGLHGMAATADGLVMLTWLDLRDTGTRLYGAVSRDHGATWSADTLVYASPDQTICQCCHPSVAADAKAGFAVMFRNHVGGSRDLYVTRSSDGRTFGRAEKQGVGTWKLDACPMDGGDLGIGADGVTSVWRRQDGIFLSRPGAPERQIGVGRDPVMSAASATARRRLDDARRGAAAARYRQPPGGRGEVASPARLPCPFAARLGTTGSRRHAGSTAVKRAVEVGKRESGSGKRESANRGSGIETGT